MKKKSKLVCIGLLLLMPLVFSYNASAKPFYEGKVIKEIVCTKPGGAYDFYARLMANAMKKYLPGSTIIVKNIVGAGGVIGANAIYKAKPDGLTFGVLNRAAGLTQLSGMKGVRYDVSKMSWLGSPASELTAFIVNAKKFQTLDDVLKAENMRMATGGVGTVAYVTTLLFYKMLGQNNYTIGTGYAGGEIEMSIMRGAMDGHFGAFQSRKIMIEQGFGRVLLFIGRDKPDGYENVPLIQDVIKDEKNRPVIDLLRSVNVIGKPFAGPPDIPKDRLAILRKAFENSMKDPELLKQAKAADRPIGFENYMECEKYAKNLQKLDPIVVKLVKDSFKQN